MDLTVILCDKDLQRVSHSRLADAKVILFFYIRKFYRYIFYGVIYFLYFCICGRTGNSLKPYNHTIQVMEQKIRAIVLRTTKYGDDRLIIDMLSREMGRLSVIWRMHKGVRGRQQRNLFQPLTIIEANVVSTPRRELALLGDTRLATVYTSLPFDGVKVSLAFFVAEFLTYATREMHTDMLLYDFVEQSLIWLDAAERGIANFHMMFMLRMSRFLGFYPDVESYQEGSFFDLREGKFTETAPFHSDVLQPQDARIMLVLMRMKPSNLHLFQMSRSERNRIIDFTLQFYRLHIPSFKEMKTLDVLRML